MSLHTEILRDPEARRSYEEEVLFGEATGTIAALLESLGISKQEYARRLDVTPGRVSQLLSGRVNLTMRTLASLAWALGMQVSLSIEPMANRMGTPAEDDPPAPLWLDRLRPTAEVVFTGIDAWMPGAGPLDASPAELRIVTSPAA